MIIAQAPDVLKIAIHRADFTESNQFSFQSVFERYFHHNLEQKPYVTLL